MKCYLEFNCNKIILLNIFNMFEGYVIFLIEILNYYSKLFLYGRRGEKRIRGWFILFRLENCF